MYIYIFSSSSFSHWELLLEQCFNLRHLQEINPRGMQLRRKMGIFKSWFVFHWISLFTPVFHCISLFWHKKLLKTKQNKKQKLTNSKKKNKQVGLKFANYRRQPSSVCFLQLNMGKNTVYTTILKIQGDIYIYTVYVLLAHRRRSGADYAVGAQRRNPSSGKRTHTQLLRKSSAAFRLSSPGHCRLILGLKERNWYAGADLHFKGEWRV